MILGRNVAFADDLGIGTLRVNDLCMQGVTRSVWQNELIGAQMNHRTAANSPAVGCVNDLAPQLGTIWDNDTAIVQKILA